MCGIYSYIGREHLPTDTIFDSLEHRGPDDRGYWQGSVDSQQIHLIHTRLSIVDLSTAGHQPMIDSATGNVIVFNGEIYNYLEIRQELKQRGLEFHSHSDTEVLLLGYRVWGEKILDRLDGMFAFIIFDKHRQQLFVARDHIGIKPLYYAQTQDGGISFASEVRTLMASGLVDRDWDDSSIHDYLVYGCIQESNTIRRAIKAFPPAHYAVIDLSTDLDVSPKFHPYWHLAEYTDKQVSLQNTQEIHDRVLDKTLSQQLMADVPVGLFLSAGIDSTVLAKKLAPISNGRLTSFTFKSLDSSMDESPLAATISQRLGLKHLIADLDAQTIGDWLLDSFRAMDQPSGDGTNTYLVSRASAQAGIVVVLSGCGADEIHGGYPHFQKLRQLSQLAHSFGKVSLNLLPTIGRLASWRKSPIDRERLELLLSQIDSSDGLCHEIRRYLTPTQIEDIYPQSKHQQPRTVDYALNQPGMEFESQIALAEVNGYLRNMLLRDSDWATMANQQELRVPYLGKEYIETVLGLSWQDKRTTRDRKKPLLSSSLISRNSELPSELDEITRRPKTGFALDYGMYLLNQLRETMYDSFEYLNQAHGFAIDIDRVEREIKTGNNKLIRRYWALTSLGFYLHQYK
jgi:asparagine synthase (glutamine-hydrolysing)